MNKRKSRIRPLKPCAVGTGLLALDVVVNLDSGEQPRSYAGGTCGNVLTVLSYLGWHTAPISRLAPGPAAERLLADLADWKVATEFVSVEDGGSTPVIIERIARRPGGEPYHTFSWRCPGCGAHLPGYRPILATTAQALDGKSPPSQVFFFDRVSRGTLHLAQAGAERGAVVVFEPSGVGDPGLFREAWALAHVVKHVLKLGRLLFRQLDIAVLARTEGRDFACATLIGQHHELIAGLWHLGQALNLDRDRWSCFRHRLAVFIQHRAHTTIS